MEARRLRDALFYRLPVTALYVPPSHELGEDLMAPGKRLPAAAAIRCCRWPGNVREPRNAIDQAVRLARSAELAPDCLPHSLFLQLCNPGAL